MAKWFIKSQSTEIVDPDTQSHKGWPVDIVGLLCLLVGLLIYFQYTTLNKFIVLPPAVPYIISYDALEHITSKVTLTYADALILIFICTVFLSLVVLEFWRGRLTAFLLHIFQTEKRTIIALLVCSLILVRFYFSVGAVNWSGDGSSHFCYSWLASLSFAQREIPIWTNYLGAGSPYLQFYGFLFFYLVGFLNLIVNQLDWTIKIVLAGAHVMSGLGMYFFVRRLCGSRQAGFVAALGYVLCMWHTQQALIMGRFPLSIFYALLPWPFYWCERLRFGTSLTPAVVGGGLTLGLLAFVHPGYGFWAVAAFALYLGVRALTARLRLPRPTFVFYGLILWLYGIVFGAYLTLPMWTERALVDLEEITHADVPDPTWAQLFLWSNYRLRLFDFPGNDHWYGGYLGLSLVILAGIGIWGCAKQQARSKGLALTFCLIAFFILVVGYRWPGIRSLDLVKAFNAGRYLLFVTFFLSATAGMGFIVLRRFFKTRAPTLATVIILAIMVDLGPTTFQHPYVLKDKIFLSGPPETYTRLRQGSEAFTHGQLPNFRLSYPMDDVFYLLGIAWYTVHSGVPSFLTGYREGPQAQTTFGLPVQKLLEREFRGRDLSNPLKNTRGLSRLETGLYLLNVRNTFIFTRETGNLISAGWQYFSPIVVAPEAIGLDTENMTDEIRIAELMIDGMEVIRQENTCRRIFLKDPSKGQHLHTTPKIEILDHQVWNQKVELKIQVSEPCFARLAYAYYPYLGVYMNNKRVESLQTADGFIAIKLDPGEHQITLEPHLSPLRRILLILNVVLLIAAFVLLWKHKRSANE